MRFPVKTLLLLAPLLLASGCSGPATPAKPLGAEALFDPGVPEIEKRAYARSASLQESDWQKHFWLEKAARALRNGHGLDAGDDVPALLKLSREEIIDAFMRDPRFGDAVLDFNTYFLGFKMNDVRVGKNFSPLAYEFPNAVRSAQSLARNGDYFDLFELRGPLFVPPLKTPKPLYPPDPAEANLKQEAIRSRREAALQKELSTLLQLADSNPPPAALCERAEEHLKHAQRAITYLVLPNLLLINGPTRSPAWYPRLQELCEQKPLPASGEIAHQLHDIFNRNAVFFAELARFEPNIYQPASVAEIKAFDLAAIGMKSLPEFGSEEVIALINSSTNMNRKRSAYVLSRYLCDDLSPIGVENPAMHAAGGKHGTDPSCFACHYKLDPMAGFFRDYGEVFLDFSAKKDIIFDDNAKAERAKYEENWRAPTGAKRDWNVGYVRSPSDDRQNSYGSSLEDLSRILRDAPEAKRCVVKRAFEYFVSRGQTVDAGYLDHLTSRLTSETGSGPAQAFRNTVKRLLLSNAFAENDLDPNRCYDFGPGGGGANAPPCRVSFLLEKNCKLCHDSSRGKGHLDLTHWTALPDGSRAFPHLGEGGEQVSLRDTLNDILDRLSTTDPQERMPKKKLMTSQDRQELYLWASDLLKTLPAQKKGAQL